MRQRATVPSTAPNDFEEIGGDILTRDEVGSDMCVRSRLGRLGIEFDYLFAELNRRKTMWCSSIHSRRWDRKSLACW